MTSCCVLDENCPHIRVGRLWPLIGATWSFALLTYGDLMVVHVKVRTNPVPLSSDAFSLFGRLGGAATNIEVKQAHNRIYTELIPKLRRDELLQEDITVRLICL